MSYIEITEAREDGTTVTYREHKKSKWLAVFLALFLGGLGVHWFYTRHYLEGFIMLGVTFFCTVMLPLDHPASYIPFWVSTFMAGFYLVYSKEDFDNYVNAR